MRKLEDRSCRIKKRVDSQIYQKLVLSHRTQSLHQDTHFHFIIVCSSKANRRTTKKSSTREHKGTKKSLTEKKVFTFFGFYLTARFHSKLCCSVLRSVFLTLYLRLAVHNLNLSIHLLHTDASDRRASSFVHSKFSVWLFYRLI